MHAFLIFYIVVSVLQVLATIAAIGKPRDIITPRFAIITTIVNTALIAWALAVWP